MFFLSEFDKNLGEYPVALDCRDAKVFLFSSKPLCYCRNLITAGALQSPHIER